MALDRALLEQQMAQLPIVQYEFFHTSQLVFSEKVRHICESECAQYGKSWACPPAVGPVDACRAHCLSYPHALLITSLSEVTDIENLETTLATREEHEALTRQVKDLFPPRGWRLSSSPPSPAPSVSTAPIPAVPAASRTGCSPV